MKYRILPLHHYGRGLGPRDIFIWDLTESVFVFRSETTQKKSQNFETSKKLRKQKSELKKVRIREKKKSEFEKGKNKKKSEFNKKKVWIREEVRIKESITKKIRILKKILKNSESHRVRNFSKKRVPNHQPYISNSQNQLLQIIF